ncbi:MAG TPA: hypothetical protein VFU15_12810, partial [Bacteroidia bacterium]|nr:hypothetical protein [Bacteroidia bacterium]
MKKTVSLAALLLITLRISAMGTDSLHAPYFLQVLRMDGATVKRTADFTEGLQEPSKHSIRSADPGRSAHISLLTRETLVLRAVDTGDDSLMNLPGNFIFVFESSDLEDSVRFLPLISDSTTATHFLERMGKVKKREWEEYRILIRKKGSVTWYALYVRFQSGLLSVNIPNKSNRQTMAMKSISPALPVIHLGHIDYTHYSFGPGISFNIGLQPTQPLHRLLADIVGPVSVEWMFYPISDINAIFAIHSSAIGLFFNSGYGLFHWGIAWYTPKYCRAEAYIGINLVPA